MSYSDYGSFNWAKKNGKWVYEPKFEDKSLITRQRKRNLEAIYGLKFDAVMQNCKNQEKYKDLPYSVKNVHHSVIGDLKQFAVVSYKGSPSVLWKGKQVDSIGYDDVAPNEYKHGKEIKKQNFTPKVIEVYKEKDDCYVKVIIDTENYKFWSVAYVKNGNKEFLSICGYGLGEHWWLDKDGDYIDWDNKDKRKQRSKKKPIEHWLREKECLQRALMLLDIKT